MHNDMNIVEATYQFERWLGQNLEVVKRDLRRKHEEMAGDLFSFFRATSYRWAQHWPELCPTLETAPEVIAVGDLHIENFGTWRDKEGRLVWGINDFDDAFPLPYTADLVRLAASVGLARSEEGLKIGLRTALRSILDGYIAGLKCGGCPFVLGENEIALRNMARDRLKDPGKFWKKLTNATLIANPPQRIQRQILDALHAKQDRVTFARRIAGLGSLGHQRFVGWMDLYGSKVAREVKARSPSAWSWARQRAPRKNFYAKLVRNAIRCPDPTVVVTPDLVIRRLSPDCSRINLEDLPDKRDEAQLLWSMGKETANVHLGSQRPAVILRHLRNKLLLTVLARAAASMSKAVEDDWTAWKQHFHRH